MRRWLAAACLWPLVAQAVQVTDDTGRVVRLEAPARRVVTLAPHATELVYAAGGGSALVGVSERSDHPPAARRLPRVAAGGRVDVEAVLALAPDLVIAWGSGNRREDVDRLAALGVPVFTSEIRRLAGIPRTLERLGRLLGTGAAARRAAQAFRRALADLPARSRRVPVFLEISHRPLMTLNGEHLASEVLRRCGGHNVFAGLSPLAATVSVEAVLARRPRVILVSDGIADLGPVLAFWRRLPGLGARVFTVPADTLFRPTPRILAGLRAVCAVLGRDPAAAAGPQNTSHASR